MGVKKQPDIQTCFVNTNATLDNNPIYQSNKQRLLTPRSESHLSMVASEASFAMAISDSKNMPHTSMGEPGSSVHIEYGQFVHL
jgi:hypothetical protein